MSEPEDSDFLRILVEDVDAAIARRNKDDMQSTRRDLVRAVFAAIDGIVWAFRETVVDAARDTYGLTIEEQAVLSETTYSVSKSGQISTQAKFVPQRAMIKLVARIAFRISGEAVVDFSEAEWSLHKSATDVRNRITHPKSATDLHLSDHDVGASLDAFFWLFARLTDVMASTVNARLTYLGEFRETLRQLEAGHPETTALYKSLLSNDDK